MTSLDEQASPLPEGEQSDQPETPAPAEATAQRRPADPDAVCATAVSLARGAAEELARPGEVGDHLGVLAEGERLVTHYFACLAKGYRGWRWAITVSRGPRARTATVCETVLLPGDDAVLAPAWVPWSDRLAPGDLGPADVLPYREDDPLLQPGYAETDDEESDRLAVWELGLGRARVLGPLGRDEAAARWYHGDRGPTADEAVHAAAACSTCGYFLPLAGTLRQVFGVCANPWSPSDARVVSVDHGCGAHSETDVERPEPMPLPEPILDETGAVAVALPPRAAETPPSAEADVAEVSESGEPAEAGAAEVPESGEAAEADAAEGDAAEADVIVLAETAPVGDRLGDVPAGDRPAVVVVDADDPGDGSTDGSGGAGYGADPQSEDDGTGVWEGSVPESPDAGAAAEPAWTDPGLADAPGADPGDGAPGEGEPAPGELAKVLGDQVLLVGDGITPVETVPLRIIGQIDVGPAVRPARSDTLVDQPAVDQPAGDDPAGDDPAGGDPADGTLSEGDPAGGTSSDGDPAEREP